MPFLNFNSAKPGLKLVITIMFVITIGLIVSFVGFLLSRVFFHLDVPKANEILHSRANFLTTAELKYYQILNTISFFIVPGIFLSWLFSTPSESYVKYDFPYRKVLYLIIPLVIISSIPFLNYLLRYNGNLTFPPYMKNIEISLRALSEKSIESSSTILHANNIGVLFINLIFICLLPAVGEEIIFRGIIQKIFVNISRNNYMAVIFAAILFAAFHGDFFAFIPRFILGLFLGYLLIWGGSIWLPIYAHFIYNAIIAISSYLYEKGYADNALNNCGLNLWNGKFVLISMFLLIIGLLAINKLSEIKQAN